MHKARVALVTFALVGASVAAFACSDSVGQDPNGIAYSFAVMGCNRVAAPESIGVVSTANVPELNATFADIAAMNPKPAFLFFAGDLVFGYTNDSTALDRELKGWIALYQASPLNGSGVELVTVPGNHETDNLAKVAYEPGERTWLRDMTAYITRGGNG
ncbi:MAG TPA: metallophosphoesterase family protein, partial [Gemmatimonadaceae bacterium]|nr:metallophosphoesterase family protein [Gemmatimonadaceae bacterium]